MNIKSPSPSTVRSHSSCSHWALTMCSTQLVNQLNYSHITSRASSFTFPALAHAHIPLRKWFSKVHALRVTVKILLIIVVEAYSDCQTQHIGCSPAISEVDAEYSRRNTQNVRYSIVPTQFMIHKVNGPKRFLPLSLSKILESHASPQTLCTPCIKTKETR